MVRNADDEERSSQRVGALLADARKAAGLRQTDVVKATTLSQAQLSRIENGDSMPRQEGDQDQVAELVALYGIRAEQAEWLAGVVEDHHSLRNDKRRTILVGRNVLHTQRRFRRLDQRTTRIRSFSMGMVLGQVQERATVEAIFGGPGPAVDDRLRRGVEQPANSGRRYEMVMHENVARWPVGSLAVMADQLDHLVTVSHLPNVDLRWITGRTVTGVLPGPGFHIYDDDAVVLAQVDGNVYLDDEESLAQYTGRFTALRDVAIVDDDARAEIARLAEELRA